MIIPKDLASRDLFYQDLIEKCNSTRQERSEHYDVLRHYFLFGRGPNEEETPYNKIFPHIDLLASFLFASETTRFAINIPPSSAEIEYARISPLTEAIHDIWETSNADQVFGQALLWSLVFDSMFVKLIVRVNPDNPKEWEVMPFPVDPSSMGVLREDTPHSDRQEALVHTYHITRSQLEHDLAKHPSKEKILANASAAPVRSNEQIPSGAERIIMQAVTPTMVGNTNIEVTASSDYKPKVAEPLIEMQELWVWNDEISDYQVVTRMENTVTIFDRKNFFIPCEHPFIQVCPNPIYSYYWGMSEVARLIGLQQWRNKRVKQIDDLLDKEVDPPTALTGWMGLIEETNFALNKAGGVITTDSMNAKAQKFAPEMPQNLFGVIHEIDNSFAEMSGLQNIMMGKGESGVRSGRQTSELARLGSARIKKRALIIEDSLEKMATLYLKIMQKHSASDYVDEKGTVFIPNQFTNDYTVKVDGHSNSPLFVEDHKQEAGELFEAHAIDRASLIEIISPPMKKVLLRRLKEIEKREQQQAAMEAEKEGQKNKAS